MRHNINDRKYINPMINKAKLPKTFVSQKGQKSTYYMAYIIITNFSNLLY